MNPKSYLAILIAAALIVVARSSLAGDCCCSQCGGCQSCQKVCRLVCEEKKVDVVCWGCLCEDFCLPKHNKPGCTHCKCVCADCETTGDPDAPHVEPKRFVWRDWIPGCATMHTRKKLMKKTESVTVKSFKWVVEDLCSHCEANCGSAVVEPTDHVPLPPRIVGAKLLYSVSHQPEAVLPAVAQESAPIPQ
jgi:hypothetical protein